MMFMTSRRTPSMASTPCPETGTECAASWAGGCHAMRQKFVRVTGLAIVVFFGLVAAEAVLLAAIAGSAPNQGTAPLAEQGSPPTTLWHSNPAAALPLIAQTPVFVIAHQEPADSLQAWGLYFFPLTFFVHLTIAVVAALLLRRVSEYRRRLQWLTAGGAALAFAVTYTRFATCCTGGPRWAPEVGLYALAFDPTRSLLDWSAIYTRIDGFLPSLQFATGLAGIACLIVATLKQKSPG